MHSLVHFHTAAIKVDGIPAIASKNFHSKNVYEINRKRQHRIKNFTKLILIIITIVIIVSIILLPDTETLHVKAM